MYWCYIEVLFVQEAAKRIALGVEEQKLSFPAFLLIIFRQWWKVLFLIKKIFSNKKLINNGLNLSFFDNHLSPVHEIQVSRVLLYRGESNNRC